MTRVVSKTLPVAPSGSLEICSTIGTLSLVGPAVVLLLDFCYASVSVLVLLLSTQLYHLSIES